MRPEGWDNPFKDADGKPWDYGASIAYEKGASAMLEGLKKEGSRVDIRAYPNNCYVQYLLSIPAKGYLVFIPDEVNNEKG